MDGVNHNHKRPSRKFFYKIFWLWLKDHLKPMQKIFDIDPLFINPDHIRIWRIGHATFLIDLYGTMILTDPVLVNWIPFPRRITECPYNAEDIPKLDYIVVSHAHMDHFNRPTLKKLAHKTDTLVIPKNCSDLVKGFGFNEIIELEWGDSFTKDGVTMHGFRPEHWGQRFPWERIERHYNAFIFEKEGKKVYFGGDSGYGPFIEEIGKEHDIEVAIIGIGAYCPDRLLQSHKNPEQAVDATIAMDANHMIPMHYGDFRLSLEHLDEPVERLHKAAEQAGIIDRIRVLENGKNVVL